MSRQRVSKAHIQSSIEAVKACDLPIVSVTVQRDGSVLIETVDRTKPDAHLATDERQPEPWT